MNICFFLKLVIFSPFFKRKKKGFFAELTIFLPMQMESEELSILASEHQQDIEMPMFYEGDVVISVATELSSGSACIFSKQENNTLESTERSKSAIKLFCLIIFSLIAMVVEVVGGFKANSLAVMTDAAHLLTDIAGFSISLFAVWASGWNATSQYSFGFNRFEILGALVSVQLIWLISGILVYEAVDRIVHKSPTVNGQLMFGVAAFGFLINIIMVTCIGHDHAHHACGDNHHIGGHVHGDDHGPHHEGEKLCAATEENQTNLESNSPIKTKMLNINLQGAYLHIMADLIQSAGVMIAGLILWVKPGWSIVDLSCTLIFAAFALSTTVPMLKTIFVILMERTPSEINVARLQRDLECIKGVQTIHDLHVWAITVGKLVLSCHVIAEPAVSSSEILDKIRDYCQKTHRIYHVTVQIE